MAVTTVAAIIPWAGTAQASFTPSITRPFELTKVDLSPDRTYGSPFVLVDPNNPMNVVAASVEMRSQVCVVWRSRDGGQTWEQMPNLPAPANYPLCFNTSGSVTESPMAWGRNDALYLAMDGFLPSDGGNTSGNLSVIVSRSTDFGNTWTKYVARDNRGKTGTNIESDRPISGIAVDSKTGPQDIIYVSYRHNQPGVPSRALVITSMDAGKTWSDPVDIAAPFISVPGNIADVAPTAPANNVTGFNPEAQVDKSGKVYVLWEQRTSGISPAPNFAYYMTSSTDHGKTWATHLAYPSTPNLAGGQFIWSPEGGSQGTLEAVWHVEPGQTQGYTDIYFRNSTDGGVTWSAPVKLNDDDPAQLHTHLLPGINMAPNGRIDVAWWDFRNDPGTFANDVYYTYSTDNGATWAKNVRITDRSINRKIGPWGNNFDMRQPPGIGSTNNFVVFGWDDTRNGNAVGQAQDIYSSVYQFQSLPAKKTSATKYVLAAFIGVAVVGIGLLLAAAARGRRKVETDARASAQTTP
jgi:Neuraminidase (sialidase)